jgi:DNA-binding XRE family transcriptional regulator
MSPEQCRDARLTLGLTQRALARRAGTTQPTVGLFERTGHIAPQRVALLQIALQAAGASISDTDLTRVDPAAVGGIDGEQCKAARALLCWPQHRLAFVVGLRRPQIRSFEARGPDLFRRDLARACKLRAALEQAGVEFVHDGTGPCVRLRMPDG